MMPALLISRSSRGKRVSSSAAAARTEPRLDRSRPTTDVCAPGEAATIWLAAVPALVRSRHASTTRAPRLASTAAISNPMPELAPVTTATRPA
jgi:hypothetical protein